MFESSSSKHKTRRQNTQAMSTHQQSDSLGVREMKNSPYVMKQLLSEFLGSFLYLSLVLSAGISTNPNSDPVSQVLVVAMANGAMIASVITIFGHVSGGHINPAVTLGCLICRHIKFLKALCYVVVQIVGAIAGAAVAKAVSSATIRGNLGAIIPYEKSKIYQILIMEFLMTFVLVSVVLSVVDRAKGSRGLGSAPLAIGISITAGICCCGSYTGCLNPLRSLGPAVIMGKWQYHWVYWVGPMLGGLVAGLMYRCLQFYHDDIILLATTRLELRGSPARMEDFK